MRVLRSQSFWGTTLIFVLILNDSLLAIDSLGVVLTKQRVGLRQGNKGEWECSVADGSLLGLQHALDTLEVIDFTILTVNSFHS